MIRLPEPADVIDAAGVDPESFRAERDRAGRMGRWLRIVGGLMAAALLVLHFSGMTGRVGLGLMVPGFIGGVFLLIVVVAAGSMVVSRRQQPVVDRLNAELVVPVLRSYAVQIDRLNGTSGSELHLERAEPQWVRAVEVVDTGDRVRTDDALVGVLAGEPFMVGEYKVTERRGTKDNRRTVTLFHGTVARVRTARPVAAPLRIVPRGKENFSGAGLFSGGGIPLENPAMGDGFKVFTDTPQDAYFVLPQTVQEGWVMVAQRHGGAMGLRAEGDQLLVALDHGGNVFDVSLRSREPVRTCLEKIVHQVNDTVQAASLLGAWGGRMERPRL